MKIFVPNDAAAVAVGADRVAKAIASEARSRNIDITIIRNGSRGMFWLEPLVEVSTSSGRTGYGPVKPSDVASLFDAGFLDGKPHATSLGMVEEIPFFKRQTRLTFARAGITDPISLDDYRAHGGYKGLEKAISMGPAAIVTTVKESGLRGRGGAGFPTGIKWETVARAPGEQKYVVCNADEGDSGTYADRMIMEGDPFVLIEGMTIAGIAVGATKGYIYARAEYPHGIAATNKAIATAYRAGL
ncbi:MAG TPA: formate dehydrogenase, partial [Acetobacteraceae bacterium]|nr:formate dehydrogenase [Acetobacteraceae bacterium]